MIHMLQQGQVGRRAGVGFGNDIVRLRFEGPNLANTYVDEGTAESIWTGNSTSTVHLTTAYHKDGASALAIDSNAVSLSTLYTAANAITSGEWFVGFWAEPFTTFASRYLIGVEDTTGTAAGSAWIFYHDASRRPFFYYSDGTTRTSVNSASAVTSGTEHYYACEKVGTKIYFSIDGTVVNAGGTTFTNSLNLPSGKAITIGVAPGGAGPDGLYVDMLQIRRASVFGGANFTAPTSPIP